MYRLKACVLLCVFFVNYFCFPRADCYKDEEPVCTSRFDYDYKMLQKILVMEVELDKLASLVKDKSERIQMLEEQRKEEIEKRLSIKAKLQELGDKVPLTRSGATYVRWGRTACPGNGTEMIYKGFAAGSHYTNKGAAANFLCLPEEPVWNVYDDASQTTNGLFGVEYEFHHRGESKFFGKELDNKDAPCCVCQTKRDVLIMIPARNKCYKDWTLEYQGYLVAGRESHESATEYVCLDEDAEAMTGGGENQDGRLFYMAESKCGSLRCPPYVNGRELTCAVCSK